MAKHELHCSVITTDDVVPIIGDIGVFLPAITSEDELRHSVIATDDVVSIVGGVKVCLPAITSKVELGRSVTAIDDVVLIMGGVEVRSFEVDPTTNVMARQTMVASLPDTGETPQVPPVLTSVKAGFAKIVVTTLAKINFQDEFVK